MEEDLPETIYNVLDISEDEDLHHDFTSEDDSSVSSEVFKKIIEFDEMFDQQLKDFSTPKRKIEEDSPVSPNKSQRLETSDTPD